jgi:hypothetical protein
MVTVSVSVVAFARITKVVNNTAPDVVPQTDESSENAAKTDDQQEDKSKERYTESKKAHSPPPVPSFKNEEIDETKTQTSGSDQGPIRLVPEGFPSSRSTFESPQSRRERE